MTHANGVTNRRWWAVILTVTVSAITASFWAIERLTGDATDVGTAGTQADDGATATPVEDYIRFATSVVDQPIQESGSAAETVGEGLRKLAGALGTLELGGPEIQIDLRVAAEHILLNPAATANTDVVRDALISAAETLAPERSELRRLAESISVDRPVLDQQMTIRAFFRQSAEAIQARSS
jgi:hypothetical protein